MIIEFEGREYDTETTTVLICTNPKTLSIPREFVNLTTLYCHGTKVVEIPDNFTKLEVLDCSLCEFIQEIPETLVNLKVLNCRYTFISWIPSLVKLEVIDCSITKLSVINDRLINLRNLDCSDTEVGSIPSTLINLKRLVYMHTNIQCIPKNILKNLVHNSENIQVQCFDERNIVQGPVIEAFYHIPLSMKYILAYQYQNRNHSSTVQEIIFNHPETKAIYMCMNGHFHPSIEVDENNFIVIPRFTHCGVDGCEYYIGGTHNYLVPGCFIVYYKMKDYTLLLQQGDYPVDRYDIYLKLVDQYNGTIEEDDTFVQIIPVDKNPNDTSTHIEDNNTHNRIGNDINANYDALYHIPLSQTFVKYTQYQPLPLDNEDLQVQLRLQPKPHVVFACPRGHIHSAGDCGVPTQATICGIDGCEYLVGGTKHFIVPGCYVVYHDGYSPASVLYGNYPVDNYEMYLKMVQQYNDTIRKYPNLDLQPIIPDKKNILDTSNGIATIAGKDVVIPENAECSVCGDVLDPQKTYVLPDCGHLMCEDCLKHARQGDLYNIDGRRNMEQEDLQYRKCSIPSCGKRFRFGGLDIYHASRIPRYHLI